MRGQPFTSCKLHVASWSEPITAEHEGAFIVTEAGSAYRLERVRGRTLHVTRWPFEEVPMDAMIIQWRWTRRG